MQDNILKVKITKNKDYIINNYNIYDFFRYSDEVYPCKLVASIIDGVFFVCMERDDICFHHDLVDKVSNKYGEFELYIYAVDDSIVIWKDSDMLTDTEYNAILGVFNELKRYYEEKKVEKSVDISFVGFEEMSDNTNMNSIIDRFIEEKSNIMYKENRKVKKIR